MVQRPVAPWRNVRILLIDECGKTSLMLSLVSEKYAEEVPSKTEEITIPANVTYPEGIRDMCVVYSVDDEDTLNRAANYWLSLIRRFVLVDNKIDLMDYSTIEQSYSSRSFLLIYILHSEMNSFRLHIMKEFTEIESCIDLTEKCKTALQRIFKICDVDNDGLLNDMELNAECISAKLEHVKAVLSKNICNGICNGCVTMKGEYFNYLKFYVFTIFIQRGKNETTWAVLRKFRYDNELQMSKEYIHPLLKVPLDCSTELSHKGQEFLTLSFMQRDRDGALSPLEMESLFSRCLVPPWDDEYRYTVPTNEKSICVNGLLTLTNVRKTMEYMAYLGYNMCHECQASYHHDSRKEGRSGEKASSGKITLCRTLIDPKLEQKTMVLKDINVLNVQDALTPKYFADSKILIVANKSDLPEVKQSCCNRPLSPYSSRTIQREIFVKLATMAAFS
ncbi:hypothetical protein P5V15_009406 [Pogonomyrmex californicus]